jgi:hypothetical protein
MVDSLLFLPAIVFTMLSAAWMGNIKSGCGSKWSVVNRHGRCFQG